MISSTNLISFYFIRDTGRASSQPSGNLSNSFPDGIPVGNLIPLMRREFPMGSHNLLFGYRFLSCSDPKLNLGDADQKAPVSIKAVDVLLLASRAWLALRYARRHGSA
jgi:hypothetical protein